MKWKLNKYLFSAVIIAGCATFVAQSPKSDFAKETGPAKFLRDHNAAMSQAKSSGKPVFAFFQEVPG